MALTKEFFSAFTDFLLTRREVSRRYLFVELSVPIV